MSPVLYNSPPLPAAVKAVWVGVPAWSRWSKSSARNAMSKKQTQLWGLETSPCGVPRVRVKVVGRSKEGVSLNPLLYLFD